ncbi:MAG: CesT family type III secretion system chaperone [Mailhella sp.]|nr:CesT family type III secretion system chaperone [Mailhella sp.]
MQDYEAYFMALGESMGLDIKPGEDGACLIAVEDALPVVVRANAEARRMELTAAAAPEMPEGAAWSDILDLFGMALGPLFGSPGLGIEPESGAVVLYLLMPFATVSAADFAEAVPQFLDLARALSARLAAMAEE